MPLDSVRTATARTLEVSRKRSPFIAPILSHGTCPTWDVWTVTLRSPTRWHLQLAGMQTNAGRTGPSERRKSMKAIVQGTYGKAVVLELRDIDKPVQHTYGSADVQTATGGTR